MAVLWSSNQLAEHTFPTPAFLVDPMLPQGGLSILHGKPGVGKTLLMLALAQAVNNGTKFLNKWPTRKGAVVVVQADMTGQIQQNRLLRVIKDINIADTYWVTEEDGSTPYLNIQTMALMQRDLVAAIRDLDPLLVMWDTLRKIHHLPENASESAIHVFRNAREIVPGAHHEFTHHDRKQSRDPEAEPDADESFMGNQQWKGAVDATCSLRELGDTCVPKRMVLTFHKARTAPDSERKPVVLELDSQSLIPVAVR